jgi:hypothetical protein
MKRREKKIRKSVGTAAMAARAQFSKPKKGIFSDGEVIMAGIDRCVEESLSLKMGFEQVR